jgi:hypothetical protein
MIEISSNNSEVMNFEEESKFDKNISSNTHRTSKNKSNKSGEKS